MKFGIQVNNPKFSGKFDSEDETLDECVETSFLLDTEMAVMEWLGVFIPLHYKYSISTMLADILMMLQSLIDNKDGEFELTWPSSDFNSRWVMSWEGDVLTVESEWISVIGKTEEILNGLGVLVVSKQTFISEWKALLEKVICGLSECGYKSSKIDEFGRLKDISSRINDIGPLYK